MAGQPTYHKSLRVVQAATAKYDFTADATGKVAFTLPQGALIVDGAAHVTTAFDGTSPTVAIGTSGDTDAIFASADVAPATAGFKKLVAATLTAGALDAPLAADTDIVFTVSEPGDGTEGVVYVTVFFVIPFGLGLTNGL